MPIPLKSITNRRAIDNAFKQHHWTMQDQASNMAGRGKSESSFGYGDFLKSIGNKKAIDTAFQRHSWELQKEDRQSKDKKDTSDKDSTFRLNKTAMDYANKSMEQSSALPGTPEYNQAWQQLFESAKAHLTGQSSPEVNAANMASGGQEFSLSNPSQVGVQSEVGQMQSQPTEAPQPNDAADQYQEGMTAVNPKTGKRLQFKGGKWVLIK